MGIGPPLLVALALLCGACRCNRPPTGDEWFRENEARMTRIREMVAADQGRVRAVGEGFGKLGHVQGASGACASRLRSGDFPWTCTLGEDGRQETARDLDEAARFLGVTAERLREYERALPTRGFSVDADGRCLPKGSIRFFRFAPHAPPCAGPNDVVWAPSQPVHDATACPTTVALVYRPLGRDFYEARCADANAP